MKRKQSGEKSEGRLRLKSINVWGGGGVGERQADGRGKRRACFTRYNFITAMLIYSLRRTISLYTLNSGCFRRSERIPQKILRIPDRKSQLTKQAI